MAFRTPAVTEQVGKCVVRGVTLMILMMKMIKHILFYYYSCATSFIGSACDSLVHTYTVVLTLSREVCISLFCPQSYLTLHYILFLSHKVTQTCSQPPI